MAERWSKRFQLNDDDGFLITRMVMTNEGPVKVEYWALSTIVAVYNYYHEDGCMYLRNGDPGYPPEDDISLETYELTIDQILDEYGDVHPEVILTDEEYEEIENMMLDRVDEYAEEDPYIED